MPAKQHGAAGSGSARAAPSRPCPRPAAGRPLLLYDGDCGFCSATVRQLQRWVAPAADIMPWQDAGLTALGWTREQASREVLWAGAGGLREGGARAVSRALSAGHGIWPIVGACLRLPPLSWLAAAIYLVIARNRHRLPGGTPACAAPRGDSAGQRGTQRPPGDTPDPERPPGDTPDPEDPEPPARGGPAAGRW